MDARAIGIALCLAGAVVGGAQAFAADPELEAVRRELRDLRTILEHQQTLLNELKAALARVEQTMAQTGRRKAAVPREIVVSVEGQPFKGRADAPVTMVEFSDFQCPYCGRFARDVLPGVQRELIETGKLKYVYRDYPLASHAQAKPAAQAANCAGQQGQFWAMHDWLFAHQAEINAALLRGAGAELGLDVAAYQACIDGGATQADIDRDVRDGINAGVRGTPAFLIGRTGPNHTVTGELATGVQPLEAIRARVEALMAEK